MSASDGAGMLSRRRLLMAAAGATLVASAPFDVAAAQRPSACSPTATQEEGPFYIPKERLRRDITEGKPGVPLHLELRLISVRTCLPITGASFDIWHCDALGVYSGYTGPAGAPPGPRGAAQPAGPPPGGEPPAGAGPPNDLPPGGPGSGAGGRGPLASEPTNHATFLRGVGLTDDRGVARFTTIFPGFYEGRVNHVHVKVRLHDAAHDRAEMHLSYTGQIFFPEAIAREVSRSEPYARQRIERTVLGDDRVFATQSGSASLTTLRKDGTTAADAYTASSEFHVDPFARPLKKRDA